MQDDHVLGVVSSLATRLASKCDAILVLSVWVSLRAPNRWNYGTRSVGGSGGYRSRCDGPDGRGVSGRGARFVGPRHSRLGVPVRWRPVVVDHGAGPST